MQSEGAVPGQWPGGNNGVKPDNSPPIMSATSGPLSVEQFYRAGGNTPTPSPNDLAPPQTPQDTTRPMSRSPARQQPRAGTGPASHTLNNAKSTPVLVPSRPAGSVKNIANKFDQAGGARGEQQPQLTVRTSHDRYRRPVGAKSPRSPTKDAGVTKLQKRRPGQPRSPTKSPATEVSFGTSSSFGSTSTVASTKSQPQSAVSPRKQPQHPYLNARPLFGEITSDGKWNGNFDLDSYGPLPSFAQNQTNRRSSDGSIALGHGRSQSHQDILQPASTTTLHPPKHITLQHKRSRSDMDALSPPQVPSMPNLNSQRTPAMYPTPPNSGTRNALHKDAPASRIPVSNRRQSRDSHSSSGPQSRSASAMSNHQPGRIRLSKSPTRKQQTAPKENSKPSGVPTRSRYHPPPTPTEQNGQTLSAKIVAPLPKTSPPLRSSRPRQPVSSATTSASRARAAERFQGPATKDGRRPSEQWLGKPYDPQQERSKRKIPELGKIDFEARRERIQRAISQNLEETRSLEGLRAKSRSRQASQEQEQQVDSGTEAGALNSADEHQAEEMNRETDTMPGGWPTPGGLTVDTFNVPDHIEREPEPNTAATEFELDESPVLGRPPTREHIDQAFQEEQPQMLTSATYQRSPARGPAKIPSPLPISPVQEAPAEEVQSPSVLENVMQMRQRAYSHASRSGTEYADDSAPASAEDSPSDLEDKWGLGGGLTSVAGSIKIMLDNDPRGAHQADQSWSSNVQEEMSHIDGYDAIRAHQLNQQAYAANGYTHSPIEEQDAFPDEQQQTTPRRDTARDETLRQSHFQPQVAFTASSDDIASDPALARVLEQYQSHGTITPDMLEHLQKHVVDLQRVSANEGSNGFMIQSLLDSVFDVQRGQQEHEEQNTEVLPYTSYEIPAVTPDTPPGWEYTEGAGTAVVYSNDDTSYEVSPDEEEGEDEEDFHVKIRKADEAWERQQRGEYLRLEEDDKPLPPPKDIGYTPRSSAGPSSATFPPDMAQGLRISTMGQLDPRDIQTTGYGTDTTPVDQQQSPLPISAPPQPNHAPPLPPASISSTRLPFGMGEVPQMPATYSERGSSELSPRARKNIWGASGSSRPSIDSQRAPGIPPMPGSISMTSFTESTRQDSMDIGADSQTRLAKDTSPDPEQKRLLKRRHIIKELLDTENTYHQDLKIIEDIYKATAVPDLISPEDKKILFGNCDEIERFSLHFYDELRKAVAPVYVPAKQMRWMNKRGSFSTMQSDGTTQTTATSDGVDDERDRTTTVGQAFLQNLHGMEQIYSCYLKNHDAANQRLSALRNTTTVKCWLDECHNNASDITSAWDLDSLLVKPTQRVSKYPMLLQQLLETTPQEHPDREALSSAARDSISMLTRINDAKKRADLVDQIVNRKRKDSDVRTGIAKAFGRRTEKLKERVGIAEAFQDPAFDQLAHKFGGHFIRLQICMRDVQDYMNRIEKAMDQISNYANSLDLFTDVSLSGSELESKWRKFGQAIREITAVAFAEHKSAVQKRVIAPMIACIKLHDGPQNAINNRKKRIVDYAKCKSIEKRGEKPDKKTVEASEMYVALNDQMKIDLPKLYSMTANLVQGCLVCFLDIQLNWYNTWDRKLRPVLEEADIPGSIQQIEPAFRQDWDLIKHKADELGICNGATLAESANFLSPSITHDGSEPPSAKRPSTLDSSKRTMSIGSDSSPMPPGSAGYKRRSSSFAPPTDPLNSFDGRMRSNSSLSQRDTPTQTPGSSMLANRPWSNSNANTPTGSFSQSRPATANAPSSQQTVYLPPRGSAEHTRSPRITSGASYFTARPEPDDIRFSGIFNSAMPSEDIFDPTQPATPRGAPEDTSVLFVCASLFEFSIDKTRREAGYPYLTYVQGEVFDVIAQKGELWLAKNQDDSTNTLGWIWEQHFVILSQD